MIVYHGQLFFPLVWGDGNHPILLAMIVYHGQLFFPLVWGVMEITPTIHQIH
jgi:hypothetical protein